MKNRNKGIMMDIQNQSKNENSNQTDSRLDTYNKEFNQPILKKNKSLVFDNYKSDDQINRTLKQSSNSNQVYLNKQKNKEDQIEELVIKYQSILNTSLQILRKINENDLKTYKEIQVLLRNKSNLKELIVQNNQQVKYKLCRTEIRDKIQIIKQHNLQFIDRKKDNQFIKDLEYFIKDLQAAIKNKQENKFQQTQISILKNQLDFYNNLKKFQENIDELTKKCKSASDKEYVEYLNKYRNLLYEWEKYKIVLGNYEHILKDNVIWSQIQQFEYQIGEINHLNQNTRNIAHGLSTVIKQISQEILTKREELKLGI